MGSIQKSATLGYSRDVVWEALTNSEELAAWLMPNTFEPIVGHVFTFRTDPGPGFDGTVNCEVLALVPKQHLSIAWRAQGVDTVVDFRLSDCEHGTLLELQQTGFRASQIVLKLFLSLGWRRLLRRKLVAHIGHKEAIAHGA
ncbi:MAG: SRPBCC domain-containing protein [Pseudomonadota bacterium]